MTASEVLKSAHTILVIDFPSPDVPYALALAGFDVVVRGGPGPEDYSVYEVVEGKVETRHTGHPPQKADLVYAYRPLTEIQQVIATAKALQAKTIWTQSGLRRAGIRDPKGCWLASGDLVVARRMIQSAGMMHITEPYIADVARELWPTS
jgi:predicted CoA-binding protein